MATRRIINSEKTILDIDADGNGIRVSPDEKSQTGPAVPAHVIVKLLLFTLAMIAGPISVYYLLFKATSNSTLSGAMAAISANVVLIAYVVVAMREDQSEALEAAEKEKSERKKDR